MEASEGATSLDQEDVGDISFDDLEAAEHNESSDNSLDFSTDEVDFDSTVEVAAEKAEQEFSIGESEHTEDELDFDLGNVDLSGSSEETADMKSFSADDDDGLDFESTIQTTDGLDDLDIFSEIDKSVDQPSTELSEIDDLESDVIDIDVKSDAEEDSNDEDDLDDLFADFDMQSDSFDESVSLEEGEESDFTDLDDISTLLDDSADIDLSAISDGVVDDNEIDEMASLMEDQGVEDDISFESLINDDEAESELEVAKAISMEDEGDIIDLSEFVDSSDNFNFESDISSDPDDEGSDDFDDLDDLSSLLDGADDDLNLADEMQTKIDMAEAFIEMEDVASAKEALNEVIESGDAQHRESARALLAKLGA